MRPSFNAVIPEQKISVTPVGSGMGTAVNVFVAGSQTRADSLPMHWGPPSHKRTLPLSNRTWLMATKGQFINDDHCPTTAGSFGLTTLTVITLASEELAAASKARADKV